ncbi:energy transducer TonB [Endozoicomonas sp. Mp262]|uniref:energy transducer TonB n=1 Tax=Endozoicomonas sp. Mp262 TaxID=2919499 RepID=UPI0021D86639
MPQSSTVTSHDRLGFTLFMAAAIHALIIFGIGFSVQDRQKPPQTLEITLATYKAEEKPDKADYLAQLNQQGSGTLEKKALPSTDRPVPFHDTSIRDVQEISTPSSPPVQKRTGSGNRVVTQGNSENKLPDTEAHQKAVKEPVDTEPAPRKKINLRDEIASLEAQFRTERQAYAKRPRIKRLTAASTLQEPGAFYKESWRRKVEKVGNLNYPEEARKEKLYGELSLMVAINRDGSLHDVEVMRSSGYKVLDDAAIRIVRLAAPFSPFGEDLKSYDLVEIIRTWRFEPGDQLFSN